MSGVAEASVWRRTDDALTRRTTRSMLVSTPATGEPLVLEGAAVSVWDRLASPATDDQLATDIAAALGVPCDEVRGNVVSARIALTGVGAIVEADD